MSYIIEFFDENLPPLCEMILENYENKKFVDHGIFLNFTPQIQRLSRIAKELWKKTYNQNIDLCWTSDNSTGAYSAILESQTIITKDITALFYVQVPNIPNDDLLGKTIIKPVPNKFIMFDSEESYNLQGDSKIIVRLDFKFK